MFDCEVPGGLVSPGTTFSKDNVFLFRSSWTTEVS